MSDTVWLADNLSAAFVRLHDAIDSGNADALARANNEVMFHAQSAVKMLTPKYRGHSVIQRLTVELGDAMSYRSASETLVADVRRLLQDAATG